MDEERDLEKERLDLYEKYIKRIKQTCTVKSNCKKCHSRGIEGWRNNMPIICTCVKKKEPKIITVNGESYTQEQWNKKQQQDKKELNEVDN
jgi:hypothetical protein